MSILSHDQIAQILTNNLVDPFAVLGMHWEKDGISVRVYAPEARSVEVVRRIGKDTVCSMTRVHDDGIFEYALPDEKRFFDYDLVMRLHDGTIKRTADAYSFLPVMTEQSRYFFNEGTHERPYDDLGSHVRTIHGVRGTVFAVWAPNAKRVSVVGEFSSWDGRRFPMRLLGASGVWELFIPGLDYGVVYKYEIKKHDRDHLVLKTDPYGYYQESPPNHGTIVFDIDSYKWGDTAWIDKRAKSNLLDRPMSIYELHLGSWRKAGPTPGADFLNYRDLAHQIVDYVKKMGFTHIELMPVQDHPYIPSWGYQVGGFYAPNHRFGNPAEFQYFVDYLHRNDIAVIMDWVPGHFPKDAYGLAYFDGSHLYEYSDPREGEHKDWGTLIVNLGRSEVKSFMVANALYWIEKYHIDGLRVDAVASMLYRDYSRKGSDWIPNKYGGRENIESIEFLRTMNRLVHERFPGAVTIAEESTAWPMVSRPPYVGGLGFTYKWNMGWMNDMLAYFSKDPIFRKYHHNQITFGLWYAFAENFVLVVSHDEVVHGKRSLLEKMPGDQWQKYANVRAFLGFMWGHPGKKLLFQGQEFGMHWEWDAMQSINWHIIDQDEDKARHQGLARLVADLNHLYQREGALWEQDFVNEGFAWIDLADSSSSVVSFLRMGKDPENMLVVACNFTPAVHHFYRIGVPNAGKYREVLNTDAIEYGGSGAGNSGGVVAEEIECHGRPFSVSLTLPPLGVLFFRWAGDGDKGASQSRSRTSRARAQRATSARG